MADTVIRFEAVRGECPARSEDLALVEGLRRGAESAYEKLLEQYQQPVYNLVCRLVNDPNDASDVVQEVFLKIFRKIGAFRGDSSLKTWVYRIAVNEAQNRRRWYWRHRRQEVEMEPASEYLRPAEDYFADDSASAFDLVASSEAHEAIEQALAELSPAFRTAVILRDVDEMSYEEIASVLEINLGTVKSRIQRGREALRRILVDRLPAVAASRAESAHSKSEQVLGMRLNGVVSGD